MCHSLCSRPSSSVSNVSMLNTMRHCSNVDWFLPIFFLSFFNYLLSLLLFFSSLVCTHQGHLRTNISSIDQASLFYLLLISRIIHAHFILTNLYFIWLVTFFMHCKSPSLIISHCWSYPPHLVITSLPYWAYFRFVVISFNLYGANINVNVTSKCWNVNVYSTSPDLGSGN